MFDGRLTHGSQDLGRIGTTGTIGGAVAAIMTEPDIRIFDNLVFHTPLGHEHFLAGVRLFIRGDIADHRAGGALIAFLQ